MTPDPLLLRVEDAARLLSLGRTKVYELIREGQLHTVRVGRSTRVRRSEVERFVSELP